MTATRRTARLDRSQLDPEIRRRIEFAALDVFAEREFHRVTIDEVARAANASLQTIYRYYGGKDGLLSACLDHWLSLLAARMVDHLKGIETYKDRLRKVFWVVLDFFDQNPKIARLLTSAVYPNAWGAGDSSRQQAELTGTFLRVLAEGRSQGILTDQVSERVLFDYFYGVLARLVQMHFARGEKEPLADQANLLFEMLWRAIARPS